MGCNSTKPKIIEPNLVENKPEPRNSSSNASKIPHKLNFSHTDYTATSNHDLKNEIVSDLFHFLPPMVLYKLTETNIEEGIVLLKTRILKNGAILAKLFVEVIADISNIEKSRTGEILKEKNERIERMNSQDMDDYVQKVVSRQHDEIEYRARRPDENRKEFFVF